MKFFTFGKMSTCSDNTGYCETLLNPAALKTRNRFGIGSLLVLMIFGLAMLMPINNMNAQNIQGVAPVQTPLGGFAVDGNAFVKFLSPAEPGGDWFFERGTTDNTANPGGLFRADYFENPPVLLGNGVFTDLTNPELFIHPNTFLFRDDITNNDPTIFTGSNKINDSPLTYTWGAGSSPNKNEIQNAIAHFTNGVGDNSGDLWMLFAADRQVTNGSSYIDFEILQNTLTMTGTTSGGFQSAGPDGGRTVGDILVTIEFTQGGGEATAVIRRWEPSGSGFIYNVFTSFPAGTIFITNNTSATIVPYSIYNQQPLATGPFAGYYQYSLNQWAEGAVNISGLFALDPCFNISTLFVRTRTSGSSGQSELKDFPIRPIQLELDLTADITVTDPPAVCSPSTVDITGAASGCGTGFTLSYWTNSDGTGAISDPTALGAGTYYIKCTNNSDARCFDIKPVVVTVNPLPTVSASNTGPYCLGENIVLTATFTPAGVSTSAASWSWTGPDGFASIMEDPTAFASTAAKAGIYTVEVTDNNGCKNTAQTTVVVNPLPTVSASNTGPYCLGENIVLTATFTSAGTSTSAASWSWTGPDGFASSMEDPTAFASTAAKAGIYTVEVTDNNGCKNTAQTTVVVNPLPTCSASNDGPVCIGDDVNLSETGGDAVSWSWSTNGSAIINSPNSQNTTASGAVNGEIFSVTITDINGCTSTCTTTVSVITCITDEGCTLGYWKEHTNRWCDAYQTCDLYGDVFTGAPAELAGLTLQEVLNLGGGGIYNLGRQSVAALLNTCSSEVGFYYSDVNVLIAYVNTAFASGNTAISMAGMNLDGLNSQYCPLGGTSATTEPSPGCAIAPAAAAVPDMNTVDSTVENDFRAYPVPFKETLNIQYKFDYVSDVTIQIFDMRGQLMLTAKEASASKDKVTTLSVDFVRGNQVYIVQVKTDRETFLKKVVSKE